VRRRGTAEIIGGEKELPAGWIWTGKISIVEEPVAPTGRESSGIMKKGEPTDVQLVFMASAWLGISEFQVFSDAWQAWYNETPSDRILEPYFINFLEQGTVPFWLRSHVRNVLSRKDLYLKERKRFIIGSLLFYIPLIIFFAIIMWSFYR